MIRNKAVTSTVAALELQASLPDRVAMPRHCLCRLMQCSTTLRRLQAAGAKIGGRPVC